MKRIALLSFLLSSLSFADTTGADNSAGSTRTNLQKDVSALVEDAKKTGYDLENLWSDVKKCVAQNIPSAETLAIDGAGDACLRQIERIAVAVKELEKRNPINGAILRDVQKGITIGFKLALKVPVDRSGRLYDRSDFYAQMTKVGAKAMGFGALYAGGAFNPTTSWLRSLLLNVALFSVNNGGDVLSQGVLDAGSDWRKNQTQSFEEFLIENYSIRTSIASIPGKSTVSYVLGAIMNGVQLMDAVELFMLTMLNQIKFDRAGKLVNTASWNKKLSFMPGFTVALVASVVKSSILTTFGKSTVAGIKGYIDTYGFALPNSGNKASAPAQEKQEL